MANFNRTILMIIAALFLTGCQDEKDDLVAYVANVKSKQKAEIEPMPVMKAYEKFSYSAGELRNPFIPTVIDIEIPVEEEIKKVIDNGIRPDKSRLKEVLEAYALNELRLVGTLEQEKVWALIRAPEGIIHKVKVGDYLGQNDGQILTVTDTEITLKEIVPDDGGGYIKRDASLSVIDVN
ncbi:MAG: pilus assembly protein PilP [Methylococcaceae bacterium]|nr:pilus assembly protein PilP [Methylococcaceae bacterium]